MSIGNVLYLLMSTGMFSLFSFVLAYQSWQQSRRGGDFGIAAAEPAKILAKAHA